jgi:hypothetical protein
MALDAAVYCDCFERGRLRRPPPAGCKLSVTDDGSLLCGSDDLDVQMAFDAWCISDACEHNRGLLSAHRIGNIALVAALRSELQRRPEQFPLLLSRVLYNGVHAGDFIAAAEVPRLCPEVAALAELHSPDPAMEQFLRDFAAQMAELVESAQRVGKPISF